MGVMGARCLWVMNRYELVVSFFIVYQEGLRNEEEKNGCQRGSVCDSVWSHHPALEMTHSWILCASHNRDWQSKELEAKETAPEY